MVLTAAYNAASSRTQLKATIASTLDFQNDFTYDNLQRQTKVEQVGQSGGNTVASKRLNYAYNAASFLTSVVREYKPVSTWTEVATSAYSYDDLNRTTGIDHKKAGTSLFTPYGYTYDRIDRITGITSQDGTVTYAYDPTSQLTSADYSYQTDQAFSFDANGNWNMTGYGIGTNNQMTSDGVYNYLYDDEGNRTKRTKISDGSYTEYGWDHRQRLTSITNRNSAHTILSSVSYTYDALNRRVQKSFDADGSGGGAAVPTNFVYDVSGTSVLLEFGGSSNLLRRNLWAEPLDQLLAVETAANATTWGLSDINRTVRDVIDNLTAVQNHIKWDASANATSETNAAIDYLMGQGGMVRDEETGLSYAWYRYQGNGHWLSPDPIGFDAGDPNLQRVTGNDQINSIDPTGLIIRHIDGTPAQHATFDALLQELSEFENIGGALARKALDEEIDIRVVWRPRAPTHVSGRGEPLTITLNSTGPTYLPPTLTPTAIGLGGPRVTVDQINTVVIAHELGHAVLRTDDPTRANPNGSNVTIVENVVRMSLNLPPRPNYDGQPLPAATNISARDIAAVDEVFAEFPNRPLRLPDILDTKTRIQIPIELDIGPLPIP